MTTAKGQITDPDKNLLLLLGFLIRQGVVLLGSNLVSATRTHIPPPTPKKLNGVG